MVVVKIMQGLGNQMFQYAAGRALSLYKNEPLKINIDNYGSTTLRQYELSKFFEMEPAIVSKNEMLAFNLSHPVRRIWNKILPSKKIKSLPYEETNLVVKLLYNVCYLFRKPHLQEVFEEKQFHYDENFFNAGSLVLLKGYWHSYKYFDRYRADIKKDFTVRKSLVAHLAETAFEMHNCNSIALHIRCTDKLSQTHLKLYGMLTSIYYKAGIEHIKSNCVMVGAGGW